MIAPFGEHRPQIDPTAYVPDLAVVIGDVAIGPGSSLWFHTVVRADVHPFASAPAATCRTTPRFTSCAGASRRSSATASRWATTPWHCARFKPPALRPAVLPEAQARHASPRLRRTTEQNGFGTLNVFLTNQFGPSTTQFTGQPFITQYDELRVPSTLP